MSAPAKHFTSFYINVDDHPNTVPLHTTRNIIDGVEKKLLPYTVYADGRVKSERSSKFISLGKCRSSKPTFHLCYVKEHPGQQRNKMLTIPGAELVITSFFTDKEAPLQILYINKNEMDLSLNNLIPLWTLQDIQQYWISRFFEEKGLVRIANFGLINEEINDYLITETGEIFSLFSQTWLTCAVKGGSYRVFNLNIKKQSNRRAINTDIPVHRLVCYTFHGAPPNAQARFVDHINQNKLDNFYMNLRWVDYSENNLNRTIGSGGSIPIVSEAQEWRVVGEFVDFDLNKYNFSDYEVSRMGYLRNKDNNLLYNIVDIHGYIVNKLTCKDTGKVLNTTRQRIVAAAFLDQALRGERAVVDHINGVKTDNRAVNLRYVSQQENAEFSQGQNIHLIHNDVVIDQTTSIKKFLAKYKEEFGSLQYKITYFSEFEATSRKDNKKYTIKRVSEKSKRNFGRILLS